MKTRVLILGGGLAGLSAARHLLEGGESEVLVLEAKDRPGGTAGSEVHDGFTFDYTGHLLHLHDAYGKDLILRLLGENCAVHERRATIRLGAVETPYPFQAHTRGLPREVVLDCVAGFLETVHRPRTLPKDADFLSWSRATFGEGVTRRFMRPYNEKLWRVPLSRLTTEWQGRFVPKPAAGEVLRGALSEPGSFGYNATFRYPKTGGIQALPDALAADLPPGVLRLGARVTAVDLREKCVEAAGLGQVRWDRLVNTLPLNQFLDLAGALPAPVRAARRALRWNSVWNLNLGVAAPARMSAHWTYYPEAKYPFYRVGCSSHFSAALAPSGGSSYYVEVSRPGGARVDLPKLEASVLRGLREAGVLRRGDEIAVKAWMPVPVGYVVYDRARTPAVAAAMRWLSGLGAESIGRYGGWKYSFMEETILDGKRCAERILGRASAPEAAATGELRALK
jgi:protoporphyrinogen oxidase